MKSLFLFCATLCLSGAVFAQAPAEKPSVQPADEIFTAVDEQPAFPGDLMKHLREEIKYPKSAQLERVEGRVIVRFIVDEQGNVVSPGIVRSAGAALDFEALRVVRGMPQWKPGKVNGRVVKSYFNLPISFKL